MRRLDVRRSPVLLFDRRGKRVAESSRPLSVDGTDENKPFKPRIPMYGLLEDGNFYHDATSGIRASEKGHSSAARRLLLHFSTN